MRAVGVDFFTQMMDGALDLTAIEGTSLTISSSPWTAGLRQVVILTALSVPVSTFSTEFVPGIVDFDPTRAQERYDPLGEIIFISGDLTG